MKKESMIIIAIIFALVVIFSFVGYSLYDYYSTEPAEEGNDSRNVSVPVGDELNGSETETPRSTEQPADAEEETGNDDTGSSSSSDNSGSSWSGGGCTDDVGCSEEGNFCESNGIYSCSVGGDGCLDRTEGSDCGGEICYLGKCVEPGICGNGIQELGEGCDDGGENGRIGYCNSSCSGFIGDYYVSQEVGCSDSGLGTSSQPWCNLERAQNYKEGYVPTGYVPMVQEGDFIVVRGGNYGSFDENNGKNPRKKWHIYRNNWITYKADVNSEPVLDNVYIRNEDAWPTDGDENGRNYVILDGFRIINGVKIFQSGYVQIKNSNITKEYFMPYSGPYEPYYYANVHVVSVQYNSKHITIENNDIWGNTRPISAEGNNYLFIINNTCHKIGEDGINANSNHVILDGNYIYDINRFRTSFPLFGTLTGHFIVNETVVQDSTGARGLAIAVDLVTDGGVDYINAIQMNDKYFVKDAGTIRGLTSGSTLLDPSEDYAHTDSIQIHSNVTNLTIRNNIIRRDEGGQGLKMVGPDNVKVENNLIYTTKPLYWAGTEGGITLINNTFVIPYGSTPSGGGAPTVGYEGRESNNLLEMENNIITRWVLAEDKESLGIYCRVFEHEKNIFGNNPDGVGGLRYPFNVDYKSELIDYPVDDLFINPSSFDYRVLMDSIACDGSINGMAGQAVGALDCVCVDSSDCIFGGTCVDGKCVGADTCLETEHSCGTFPSCVNCNHLDGCYGSSYREYSCTSNVAGCQYSSDSCTDCSCSCGSYGVPESTELGNCADGRDNDCDGDIDRGDYACKAVSGIPIDFMAYYRFEGSTEDYTGNNNGVWIGLNKDNYEKRLDDNYAKTFDGETNRIELPNNLDDFDIKGPFTISAWVKPTKFGEGSIISKGTIRDRPYTQYSLYSHGSGSTIRYIFEVTDNVNLVSVESSQTYNLNEWNHVAGSFDGSKASIYVNGMKADEESTPFSELGIPAGSYDIAWVGDERHSRYDFKGSIDDLIVYRRALSDSEISQIYNSQKGMGVSSLSPFSSRIWNFIKSLFTRKTGKVITGNVVGNSTS